ncbi:MAG: hypothetical protein JWQ25_2910 [Daejeonella sp.]|nr:hypothetical protein [Daejeonella sp.]
MKKAIIFSVILLATSMIASAQLPKVNFGIKGGINYSRLKSQADLTDNSSILGYQAGIFTRVGFAGMYLQPELYLGSKGSDFKLQTTSNEVRTQGSVKFTTLDLPILLGTKFGPGKLNVRFMVGPVISFKIDEKTTFDQGYQAVTDYNSYKDQSIAIQAGGGVDLGNVTVDLRYESGLSKMNDYGQKQNLWHLSLGLKLL